LTVEDGTERGSASAIEPILDSERVDRAPRQVVEKKPAYPLPARRTGREGSVLVEFVIDENGRVRDPVVLRVTGYPGFGPAVLEASRGWIFTPARHRDRTVAVRARKKVLFRIESG
jgi:TonB family protein